MRFSQVMDNRRYKKDISSNKSELMDRTGWVALKWEGLGRKKKDSGREIFTINTQQLAEFVGPSS